ncbi:MAG: aldo/keto reductase [archaeon]|nr:aldo/keto reductase [archaeon]
MKYRKMGTKIDWEGSVLGFGAMRLPLKQENQIDTEESIKMIRYAIDNGVNYVDTAWPYMMEKSEIIIGKALKDGYREKVHLATKLPMWLVKKRKDFDFYLNQQIEKLQTNPDIYLFHGLNKGRLELIKNLNLIEKMEEAKANGLIKHIGFSFHDSNETFEEILDYYDKWELCQIQYNYLDINFQAGTKGLKYAANEKKIAVIIMEPIKGGKLAIPEDKLEGKLEVKKVLDESKVKRKLPDWALQFLWNQQEVSVVLSGMSTMEQVKENINSANNSGINVLTEEEKQTIEKLRAAYEMYDVVPCTNCNYCMPCPNYVSIPMILRFLNDISYWNKINPFILSFYGRYAKTEEEYKNRKAQGEEVGGIAGLCIECGECVEKCPQGIDIPTELKKVKAILEENKSIKEVLS